MKSKDAKLSNLLQLTSTGRAPHSWRLTQRRAGITLPTHVQNQRIQIYHLKTVLVAELTQPSGDLKHNATSLSVILPLSTPTLTCIYV